ncbi:exopolyphosphatase [Pedobacter ginsengisoli]|uniref:Ppx/GppA phosphatase family protein n=1 Tax=Pedobacter ginsengisoli TaxID=363852 RepID=UPI00254B533F|nr:exopolyphosphatase [Pedobacter ginsengisoli]
MKAAVIDLGTNTFHLIIAECLGSDVQVLYKTNVPVRLGQGRINENIIIPEAFERGIQVLKDFKLQIDRHQVRVIRAIATSAVRSADNGQDFVDAAKLAGLEIEVISGDQEAAYIFEGVKATGTINAASLIMDIGGGSTEFIICDEEGLIWKKSYNIGAARLMQAYFNTDPISEENQAAIITHLDKELADLKAACSKYKPQTLVGSAGAFETFALLLNEDTDLQNTISAELDAEAYQQLAGQLIRSTHEERRNIKGLIPLRVDMIVIAAILTNYVIKELDLISLHLSTYDLKMGVLYSVCQSNGQ